MAARTHPARTPVGGAIRWDRVGRLCLLFVFIGVALLYVGPAISYLKTRSESASRKADIAILKKENQRLKAKRKVLASEQAVETEARRRGMVKSGERAYVITGLPGD
ncbi:MAG TPA: septum formation initiator family protein [Baekduia sp.]|nr:septum formation initiator family protein [Baekduia sp.]